MPLDSHYLTPFWEGWFSAMAGWCCVDLAWWAVCKFFPNLKPKRKRKKK